MSVILITGITGFTGSHLAELLIKNEKDKVFGTVRGRCRQTTFIDKIKESLTLLECDLTDYTAVHSTICEAQPDIIYHLAAQTFVPTSWRAPQETMNSNILGTLNLLEAVNRSPFEPRILIAGSSEEYGKVEKHEIPIKETNPLRPLSPYAVSKVAQDLLGYQYNASYGLKTIRTRAFNLIGPRSGEKIVSANIAKQIVAMERKERKNYLLLGNTDAIRDFNDIRDVVRAYKLAIEKGVPGAVYNISTGEGNSIRGLIKRFQECTPINFDICVDENKFRPSDVPILIGDSSKFRNLTNWKPEIPFERSVLDVLTYWRNQ